MDTVLEKLKGSETTDANSCNLHLTTRSYDLFKSYFSSKFKCEDFKSCIDSYIASKEKESLCEPCNKIVYEMFLHDPIRVYFCITLMLIHYIPVITVFIQFIFFKFIATCFKAQESVRCCSFWNIILCGCPSFVKRKNFKRKNDMKDFVKPLIDFHLTNFLAYTCSLLFLILITVSDIQYHDGHQFNIQLTNQSTHNPLTIYIYKFVPITIDRFPVFLLGNLFLVAVISNALMSGPIASVPDTPLELLIKVIRNICKFPLICVGTTLTVLVSTANFFLGLYWVFEIMPKQKPYVSLRGPFSAQYALKFFGLFSTVVLLFNIIYFVKNKLFKAGIVRVYNYVNECCSCGNIRALCEVCFCAFIFFFISVIIRCC